MSRRSRLVPWLLLPACIAACVGVLLVPEPADVEVPSARSGEPAAPAEPRSAPALQGQGAASGGTPKAVRQEVHVTVRDEKGRPLPGAEVSALARESAWEWTGRSFHFGLVGSDGVVAIDVTSALRNGTATRLTLVAAMSGMNSARTEVVLPSQASERAAAFQRDVELMLGSAAVAVGRVVDADGSPLAGILVSLTVGDWQRRSDKTDASGRYRVSAYAEGDASVIATPKDRMVGEASVRLTRGQETTVPDIVLQDGASIEGRAVGGWDDPPEDLIVATWCGPEPETSDVRVAGGFDQQVRPVVRGAALFNRRIRATPSPRGDFVLTGLAPGPWRVRADAHHWGATQHPDVLAAAEAIVMAPARGVELEISRALMTVRALDGTRPVRGAIVSFSGDPAVHLPTGVDGTARIVLPAGRAFDAVVRAKGGVPQRFSLRSLDPNEDRTEEVRMERLQPGAAEEPLPERPLGLGLAVVGPDGLPIAAELRLYGAQGHPAPVSFAERLNDVWSVSSRRIAGQGRLLITPAPAPGHYRLEADAEGCERGSIDFEVPAPEESPSLRLQLRAR